MQLINRAYDVYANEGLAELTQKGVSFSSNIVAPTLATKSLFARTLLILDRVQFREHCERDLDCKILTYSTEEQHNVSAPITFDKLPSRFKEVLGTHELSQPFVGIVPNGVIHENGITTLSDGRIILDALHSRRDRFEREFSYKELTSLLRFQKASTPSTEDYDYSAACPLVSVFGDQSTSNGSSGHSKIVLSLLPRLEGIRAYEQEYDEKPILLIGPNPRPILCESLRLLGFDSDRIVEWNGEEVHIEKMILPAVRREENNISAYSHSLKGHSRYKNASQNGLQWVRDTMLKNLNNRAQEESFSRRVYISRQDATNRRVKNREDLNNVLNKYGFVSYELSEYSWEDQMKIFSKAEVVLSPHGAGLTNIAFARDCKIIEMFGPKRKPTFFLLAQKLDFEYGMMTCDTTGGDLIVDTAKLEQLFERLNVDAHDMDSHQETRC